MSVAPDIPIRCIERLQRFLTFLVPVPSRAGTREILMKAYCAIQDCVAFPGSCAFRRDDPRYSDFMHRAFACLYCVSGGSAVSGWDSRHSALMRRVVRCI